MTKISLDMDEVFGEQPKQGHGTSSDVPVSGSRLGESNQPNDRQDSTIADVLLESGLWPTRRELRSNLAYDLQNAGFTAGDVRLVCECILSMARDKAIALGELVNLLRDHKRLRESLEDLSKVKPSHKPHPGQADRAKSMRDLEEQRRSWLDDDREHYVRCRRADGVTEDVALAEWHGRTKA